MHLHMLNSVSSRLEVRYNKETIIPQYFISLTTLPSSYLSREHMELTGVPKDLALSIPIIKINSLQYLDVVRTYVYN